MTTSGIVDVASWPGEEPAPAGAFSGAWRRLAAIPRAATWAGLVVAGLGFGLIGVAWGRISALKTVGLQLPYLVSAGLTGLGLIVVGALAVALDAKISGARAQAAQQAELHDVLRELNGLLVRESTAEDTDA